MWVPNASFPHIYAHHPRPYSSESSERKRARGQVCGFPLSPRLPYRASERDFARLVVTGASDGIGREFAIQLARAGFNVLLAARNQAKLDAVVDDISAPFYFIHSNRSSFFFFF